MPERNLLVLGGSGFVGSSICKEAVQNGWKVTSVSRSGAQNIPTDQEWAKEVNWIGADASDLAAYSEFLGSANAVVHSIAILREARNNSAQSFEHVNRDSALVPAEYIARACPNVSKFVFISVAPNSVPKFGVNSRYLTNKQAVEEKLLHMDTGPHGIIMRPGLMYGEGRMLSFGLAGMTGMSSLMSKWFNPFNMFTSAKPMPVTTLAKAVVQTINAPDETFKRGTIMEIPDIEHVSNRSYPAASNKS